MGIKYEKEAEAINKLISIVKIDRFDINVKPLKSFNSEEMNLMFSGDDDVTSLENAVKSLLSYNFDLLDNFSEKNVEQKLVNLMKRLILESRDCFPEDIKSFFEEMLNTPLIQYKFFYEFFGASIRNSFIQYGDFTIYDRERSLELLEEKYPGIKDSWTFKSLEAKLIIEIAVTCREENKAKEKADNLCYSFENIFSYAIADLTHKRRIGILNFRHWETVKKVSYNGVGFSYSARSNVFLTLHIDDYYFSDPSYGNDKIWSLITLTRPCDIKRRILTSMEWIGKAAYDEDRSKALIQFVFAIEGLLQFKPKDFLSQSIANQIGESLAFIVGEEVEERKNILKAFKEVYKLRSAVAHGVNKTITLEDLALAKFLSKALIAKLLTGEPFKDMATIEQLEEYITTLKFK